VLLSDLDLEDDEMEEDRKRWEARIRKAIKASELHATRAGVQFGDLMDWAGQEVFAYADGPHEMTVLPDRHADYVEKATRARGRSLGWPRRRHRTSCWRESRTRRTPSARTSCEVSAGSWVSANSSGWHCWSSRNG
jgi:hypothetical protein